MNKLVLISGSSRGLGAAMAKSFSEAGYQVAINYFNSEKEAKHLSENLSNQSHAFKCDVSKKDDVAVMLEDIKEVFGYHPSILINNAMTSYVFNGDG
jgi:Dehydrogenases with different specificities (related to short-chain alcohol dehydrogenases)